MPAATQSRPAAAPHVEARARQSGGTSADPIYDMVVRALDARGVHGGCLLDVGCGRGNLRGYVERLFESYVGADVIRYDGLPPDVTFHAIDLDTGQVPVSDAAAEVVVAVETIEHLENPRALVRELVRITKPGGWIVVTTPNQRSLLSLMTLVVKGRYSAFQDVHYPAHLTALLDVDLLRIGAECGLVNMAIAYSESGRMPLTPRHYPAVLSRRFTRPLSDNVLLIGRKPQ